jgi:hypothetical protein
MTTLFSSDRFTATDRASATESAEYAPAGLDAAAPAADGLLLSLAMAGDEFGLGDQPPTPLPMQEREFTCQRCFLILPLHDRVGAGSVCRECAS